ncbi:hypothetical protein [Kordia sp. SMS9]|uniref:hypothetical protein n=1 Tax=Kordia sp. SMS9 TaxID=2282170 RepID=UPI0013B44B74|nr:hypothetical protein [Kordia sp. SMS9]
MKNTSEFMLKAMRIVAWIVFIWMLVKAGAIIMSYGASVNNAEGAKDLYRGLDLSRYYEASFFHYSVIVFYYIILYLLQAYIALFVTRLLSEQTLQHLFSNTVVGILHKISATALGVFLMGLLHNIHVEILAKYAALPADSFSGEYIFLAGTIYVLAMLFKNSIHEKLSAQ